MLILDYEGNPFYWHDNKERHINFNLPVGWYASKYPIKKRRKFKPYGNAPYPTLPKGFLQTVGVSKLRNRNKASISLEKEHIWADPKYFDSWYQPLKTFTLGHELFHKVYHTKTLKERRNPYIRELVEMKCDEASKNFMLANGWNPSQVSLAVKMLLRGKGRKEAIRMATTHPKNCFRR